ncbi:hypothetical protein L208DRAFT_1408643 [Tricholoma matsutake]|nr:hypothetical protein L208DRAFT_1408643 [Tricholoma matsutake 945]
MPGSQDETRKGRRERRWERSWGSGLEGTTGTGKCTYMSIVPKKKNKKKKKKTEKRGKGYEGWEKEEISSPLD